MVASDNIPHVSFTITERSEVKQLKKSLQNLGAQIGLSPYQLGKLDIIVSEITTNFLKHAIAPGEILFKEIQQNNIPGIEIISLDQGPGMRDAAHLMQDGVSTTNSMGTGMGAIRRLSDQFDLYSLPDWGTLLLSRIFKEKTKDAPADDDVTFATLMVPYPGEELCGDGISYKSSNGSHTFLLTDGLGHGPHAHEASLQAAQALQSAAAGLDAEALIKIIHEGIAHTRGAVGMVLSLSQARQTIDYCGIGNISLRKISAVETKRGISAHGILGQNVRNCLSNTPFIWSDGLLMLHSDGIETRWDMANYPGLENRDLSLLMAAIYKDYRRKKDDCAILAIRIKTL